MRRFGWNAVFDRPYDDGLVAWLVGVGRRVEWAVEDFHLSDYLSQQISELTDILHISYCSKSLSISIPF